MVRRVVAAALALVVLFTVPARADYYAFHITGWTEPVPGYLDTDIGDQGLGAMWLGGYKWPLTGFDSWWHGGPLLPNGWHMCVVIHPKEPWIVGTMLWKGTRGKLDILSTDGVWFEFGVEVLHLPKEPRVRGS